MKPDGKGFETIEIDSIPFRAQAEERTNKALDAMRGLNRQVESLLNQGTINPNPEFTSSFSQLLNQLLLTEASLSDGIITFCREVSKEVQTLSSNGIIQIGPDLADLLSSIAAMHLSSELGSMEDQFWFPVGESYARMDPQPNVDSSIRDLAFAPGTGFTDLDGNFHQAPTRECVYALRPKEGEWYWELGHPGSEPMGGRTSEKNGS